MASPKPVSPADKPVEGELVFPLSTPIRAYDEELSVIKMRVPNGGDLVRVGNPVVFYPQTEPVKVEHDMQKMITMIARLSSPPVPVSSVETISPVDLVGLAWFLSPFFIPVP
jgi:hypothetical protein